MTENERDRAQETLSMLADLCSKLTSKQRALERIAREVGELHDKVVEKFTALKEAPCKD